MKGFIRVLHVLATVSGVRGLGIHRDLASLRPTYDYIIAGGGLTGLVVASRLSEDVNTTVLVVEYGDFDDTWNTAIPYFANVNQKPELLFQMPTTPQRQLGNRSFSIIQGATVGGGSTVNGMAVTRGGRADYNAWQELGNAGWGWDGLLPYFRKSSTLNAINSTATLGLNYTFSQDSYGHGPAQASWPPWQWPDTYTVNSGWVNDLGFQLRKDGSTDGENVGLAWKPVSADPMNFTRSSARMAYYNPASNRPNLDIVVRTVAAKVTFDHVNATGVEVISRDNATKLSIRTKKEVILAAGTTHTPQILQLSGIGPSSILKPLGIPVVQDLPGVGANLQGHPLTSTTFDFRIQNPLNFTLIANRSSESFKKYWNEYMANRTGPLTIAHGNSIFIASLQNLTADYQRIIDELHEIAPEDYTPAFYKDYPELVEGYKSMTFITNRIVADGNGVFEFAWGGGDAHVGMINAKVMSRGTVHINSTDPHPINSPPLIDCGSMTHPFDIKAAVLAFKLLRRLMASRSVQRLQPVELMPGANVTTDAEIETALREHLLSPDDANPSGTASMLPQSLGGVVDPELKVYGVNGLRVVDASIIPISPNSHMSATMYAIAEKAADLIRGIELEG